ncbi:diacylglycerol kinase [Marinobacterium sp. 3-1745]|uniref:Diacylglycerol kinase n=1 Tax=Marinobacterium marinum TaxID=2756129 RepID=A0A7W2AD24_9GAMM|nr:diacylglycerol kinase [Marinobacterium marinum]MBA4502738.1 diacylglycerol kinase [Marinobacterium marinum]
MIVTKTTGLARFYHATRYSIKGIRAAYCNEPAFRYESWAALAMLPAALWVAQSGLQLGLLISTLLLVLIMELLNTAIEAVVDRAGTEFNTLAGLAKDLGSAAVLFSLFITALIWGGILYDNFLAG